MRNFACSIDVWMGGGGAFVSDPAPEGLSALESSEFTRALCVQGGGGRGGKEEEGEQVSGA